ncbi:MAG: hypothetical protein NW207_06180 [Cytophagales bacterium]|nr:hypothetical protein [Cytophagales bacterium]
MFWTHIYCGLYATPLLLVAGFTALQYQHHFFSDDKHYMSENVQYISVSQDSNPKNMAFLLKQRLAYVGYMPEWDIKKYNDTLSFNIIGPWKEYKITYTYTNNMAHTNIYRKQPANLLANLHEASISGLDSWSTDLYKYYANTAIVAAFITICISIYFWAKKSIKTRNDAYIAIASAIFTIGIILTVIVT